MLYSCNRMVTVGVKGLKSTKSAAPVDARSVWDSWRCCW